MTTAQLRHDIVPANLAVKAMRDNGYKNIAYAIAELIDNSIQAGLQINDITQVELLCCDKTEMRLQRRTSRIDQIAVLDNSCGMDEKVLRMALQFGNGTYLDPADQTGIGRFGMGLPSSSISQCRRLDLWTWQNGVDNAIHTYLDLDEIISGDLSEVPEPRPERIPEMWRKVGKAFQRSGTLVVWRKIDRSLWRTSGTIIDKSDFLIGRMYRRFLMDNRVQIRYVTFDSADIEDLKEGFARPNDPLYLMSGTSCPGFPPHIDEGEPMFESWGEPSVFNIRFDGQMHTVRVNFAIAKDEARKGFNPGSEPHGQHAKRNVGVSIMRADRELELDPAWSDPSDPRDRWWGVEIDFPPALDDLFGVTNNKQSARYFSDLAKTDVDELVGEDRSMGAARDTYTEDQDPRMPLFDIASNIQSNIRAMRLVIRAQTSGKRSRQRHEEVDGDSLPEAKATKATNQRKEFGFTGESDKNEDLPDSDKIAAIQTELEQQNIAESEARAMAAFTVSRGFKYQFSHASIDSPAFFNVKIRAGTIIISLNINHPAYTHLIEVLEEDVGEADEKELRERLTKASDGLRLLLTAWARFEDEQPDGRRRIQAQEARIDWGRMAREFLFEDGDV